MKALRRAVQDLYARRPRGLVNPYTVHDKRLDVDGGFRLRQENLEAHIDGLSEIDAVLIGEAPGWRGARFTGIPFSSERLVLDGTVASAGHATSRQGPYGEATATVIRRVEAELGLTCFAWNALPYHPARPGQPLSNRSPMESELRRHAPILRGILDAAPDAPVVAVGRAAQRQLQRLHVAHAHVVHPGRGRARRFRDQLRHVLAPTP